MRNFLINNNVHECIINFHRDMKNMKSHIECLVNEQWRAQNSLLTYFVASLNN